MTKKEEQTQKKPSLLPTSEANVDKDSATPKAASQSEDAPKGEAANENPIKFWIDAIQEGNEKEIQASVAYEIKNILKKHRLEGYSTLMLFDPLFSIEDSDLNKLYEAASS